MELPAHPDSERSTPHRRPTRTSWATTAVVVAIGLLFVIVILLHLTGVVGPGAR